MTKLERGIKARALAELAAKDPGRATFYFYEFCDLIGFDPHDEQRRLVESSAWVRVVRWGTRCGKTRIAATTAVFTLLQDDTCVWVVAPSHELCGRVWDEIEAIIRLLGIKPKSNKRSPYHLAFGWGSRCDGKSTEHGARDKLVGEEVDLTIWDEAARSPGTVWGDLSARFVGAGKRGRGIIISTPVGRNHFEDLCKLAETEDEWEGFYAPSSANPYLDPEHIAAQRRTLSPEKFEQDWEAKFTSFVGQVYPEFEDLPDNTGHVRELKYEPDLPLYMAFDWGVEDPFVCLWIQCTGGDVVRVIDEYYGLDKHGKSTRLSAEENLDAVIAQHRRRNYPVDDGGLPVIEWAVGDSSGPSEIRTARRKGIDCRAARKQIPRGTAARREIPATVELVRRFFREWRLFYDRERTPNLQRETNLYRYPEKRENRNADETPLDADNHGPDAVRYWFNNRYGRVQREFADPAGPSDDPLEFHRQQVEARRRERLERHSAPSVY